MAIVLGNSHMFLTEIKSVNLLLVFSNCHAVFHSGQTSEICKS